MSDEACKKGPGIGGSSHRNHIRGKTDQIASVNLVRSREGLPNALEIKMTVLLTQERRIAGLVVGDEVRCGGVTNNCWIGTETTRSTGNGNGARMAWDMGCSTGHRFVMGEAAEPRY